MKISGEVEGSGFKAANEFAVADDGGAARVTWVISGDTTSFKARLIGPAATAYLLTDDFKQMLFYAALAGIVSSISGFYLAVSLDGSIAGGIATMTGVVFALAMLFSPRHGVVFRVT